MAYSLTLHDWSGRRLFGIDNAHSIRTSSGPAGKGRRSRDHVHRGKSVRPYQFVDAATLLTDFWTGVDEVTRGRVAE